MELKKVKKNKEADGYGKDKKHEVEKLKKEGNNCTVQMNKNMHNNTLNKQLLTCWFANASFSSFAWVVFSSCIWL